MNRRVAACAVVLVTLAGCGSENDRAGEPRLLVAVGDSITAGAPGWDPDPALREQFDARDPESQWPYWAERQLGDGFDFRNCGVSGDRTDAIAARLDECLEGADIVVLQGGVNDLAQGRPPENAAQNMRTMVERVREAGLPVLVANLLPINARGRGIVREIDRLNALLAALGAEEGVEVIDFFGTLEGRPGSARMRRDWAADPVHPSVEGYKRLGRAVADACSRGPCASR